MDGWMMAREEDDDGRRERVKARLDDASRLFGRVSQIGPDFKSPTEHSSLIAKSKFFAPAQYDSPHSRPHSGSVHCTRPTGAKLHSQTIRDRTNNNVEVNIAPFSTGECRKRGRNDKYVYLISRVQFTLDSLLMMTRSSHRRILEFAASINSTFESVIQTHLYPWSQVDILSKLISKMAAFSARISMRPRLCSSPLALRSLILPAPSFPASILCRSWST